MVSTHVTSQTSLGSHHFQSSEGECQELAREPAPGGGSLIACGLLELWLNTIFTLELHIPRSLGKERLPQQDHPIEKYPLGVISKKANTPDPEKPPCHGILNFHHQPSLKNVPEDPDVQQVQATRTNNLKRIKSSLLTVAYYLTLFTLIFHISTSHSPQPSCSSTNIPTLSYLQPFAQAFFLPRMFSEDLACILLAQQLGEMKGKEWKAASFGEATEGTKSDLSELRMNTC